MTISGKVRFNQEGIHYQFEQFSSVKKNFLPIFFLNAIFQQARNKKRKVIINTLNAFDLNLWKETLFCHNLLRCDISGHSILILC